MFSCQRYHSVHTRVLKSFDDTISQSNVNRAEPNENSSSTWAALYIRGEGYSPIKVTGALVVPFRALILWIGTAWGATK